MRSSRLGCFTGRSLGIALGAAFSSASASAQDTLRVSVDSNGGQGISESDLPCVSADGRVAAFTSYASNLVAGDTNWTWDVFVKDRNTGMTERVSVDSSGAEANFASDGPSISADGRFVAFVSGASNLVAGDSNNAYDIFVRDRSSGTTERVSIDSSGSQSNGDSFFPSISADGQIVAFESNATNLVPGDGNGWQDIFVHDRSTGLTERVSVDSSGAEADGWSNLPSTSADGQVVAFCSAATDLVAGDANGHSDVFVHDRATGLTERVSVDSAGTEGNADVVLDGPPSISAGGEVVAFESLADNLIMGDTNGFADVFVRDRIQGITERVSVGTSGAQGLDASGEPSISADGRLIAFSSKAPNLVDHDGNSTQDVFVHDRRSATTTRMSVDSSGTEGNSSSLSPSISADGEVIGFWSFASNLVAGDTNNTSDAFVHEACSTFASWSNYGAGFPGTNGVPSFTSQQDPVFGATITLDLANSYGKPTTGLIFIGFSRADLHSGWGGNLLVVPAVTILITFSYGGDSFTGDLPDDPTLCGFALDLQAIESDPGAAKGVSFTPGLELLLGR